MSGTRTRRLMITLLALTLAGAACGSDDDGSTTESVLAEIPPDQDELGSEPRETTAEPPSTEAAGATDPAATDPGATEPGSTEPGSTEPAPDVLRLGLQVTSVDFTTGVAVITNLGERDIDLTGYWICNRPSYAELPARTLAPGESVEASLGGFSDAGGEVAVYSSSDFGNPDDIESYVGWGSGGGRNAVAEQAGIWTGGQVQPSGDSIELTGEPGSADGWT